MKIYFVHGTKSKPSAKALAKEVQSQLEESRVSFGTNISKILKTTNFDYIINVGNSAGTSLNYKPHFINRASALRVSANKRLARIRFKAKKIAAPMLWLAVKDIPECEYPVIARITYHMKAKGFWFCKNKKEAIQAKNSGATHFIKFIKNTREFRVHVFSRKIKPSSEEDFVAIKTSEKKKTVEAKSEVIKNHDHGYHFVAPMDRLGYVLDNIRALAKKAVFMFGLHFGAVDIIYSIDTKQAFVLEINAAPCLTDPNTNTLQLYAAEISNLLTKGD